METLSTEGSSLSGMLQKASDGISVKEAAEQIGVTRATINNWIKQGKLPATKFAGSITRVDPADLDRLREPA